MEKTNTNDYGTAEIFFSQCARPKGSLGRVMLSFMNYSHAPLTSWGLSLVDLQEGLTMLVSHKLKSTARNPRTTPFLG